MPKIAQKEHKMKVRAYIITGSGTALIVPEPMPDDVVLNDEAKGVKEESDNQRVFDLQQDSAIGLDKAAAVKALGKDKFFVSHNPPKHT